MTGGHRRQLTHVYVCWCLVAEGLGTRGLHTRWASWSCLATSPGVAVFLQTSVWGSITGASKVVGKAGRWHVCAVAGRACWHKCISARGSPLLAWHHIRMPVYTAIQNQAAVEHRQRGAPLDELSGGRLLAACDVSSPMHTSTPLCMFAVVVVSGSARCSQVQGVAICIKLSLPGGSAATPAAEVIDDSCWSCGLKQDGRGDTCYVSCSTCLYSVHVACGALVHAFARAGGCLEADGCLPKQTPILCARQLWHCGLCQNTRQRAKAHRQRAHSTGVQ
jgi:hypothetical protein